MRPFSFLIACSLAMASGISTAVAKPDPCKSKYALGTSRIVKVGATGGLHIGLKSYPRSLFLRPGEVILTFDDGPLPETTTGVLNALRAECVKASFFLIGRNAQANPALVQRMIKEGHTVGHHTWSHPSRTLRRMSPSQAIQDIKKGIAAVEKAAYGSAYSGKMPVVPFFRFPGFADTPETMAWLDKRNMVVFGTDVWSSDWLPMSPQKELGLVMRRLAASGGGIVLFHDTKTSTAAMLPAFLRALKANGFRVVHAVPRLPDTLLIVHAPGRWRSKTQAILAGMGLGAAVPQRKARQRTR